MTLHLCCPPRHGHLCKEGRCQLADKIMQAADVGMAQMFQMQRVSDPVRRTQFLRGTSWVRGKCSLGRPEPLWSALVKT